MVGRGWMGVVLAMAVLPAGCSLLGTLTPEASPLPDEPAPYTLRAAVEPARSFLEERWAEVGDGAPARFRFVDGRCSLGAAAVMIFEQTQQGEPPTHALAFSDDIAAGILTNAWWSAFSVDDPETNADLHTILDGREIPCP